MCTLHHNSITPKVLRGIPLGVKLTVHEDFSDISIATVETLRFDEAKGMLLTTTLVEGNREQKEFKYQRNAWLLCFLILCMEILSSTRDAYTTYDCQ